MFIRLDYAVLKVLIQKSQFASMNKSGEEFHFEVQVREEGEPCKVLPEKLLVFIDTLVQINAFSPITVSGRQKSYRTELST